MKNLHTKKSLPQIIFFCLFATSAAFAKTPTPTAPATVWQGANYGSWETETNWSNGLPSSSTSVVFDSTSTGLNTTANNDTYVNDLFFYDGYTLGSNGHYNLKIKKSLNVAGNFYYTNLRTTAYFGGLRFVADTGSKWIIGGNATFEANTLTAEQKAEGLNGTVDVQVGSAATSYPMFAEIKIGGDLNITNSSSYSASVHFNSEIIDIGGIVKLTGSSSAMSLIRASTNNDVYISNQSWGGLSGNGKIQITAVKWGSTNASDLTANVTLKNKTDQTYTGSLVYTNVNVGTTEEPIYTTSAINLSMDAADNAAVQTITLSGSKGFTTVAVKNGTLLYSAPEAAKSLSVSGGKLLLGHATVVEGDLNMSGGSFGGNKTDAKVSSLTWTGGKFAFSEDSLYGATPDKIFVSGKFTKSNAADKISIDFDGLDGSVLIGEDPIELISATSYEGISTSNDADEYFKAVNLLNALADFSWNGNSLMVSFTNVPEPATVAVIFGALALALAIYRRR